MSSHRAAVLFPGQGAWYAGALSTLRAGYPQVSRVFAEVDRAAEQLVGGPVSAHVLDPQGPGIEQLLESSPARLQLAIYGVAVATYDVLRAHGLQPAVLVGHSFGEIAALTAGGAFTVREGAEIVGHRTAALAEAAPSGAGMVALGVSTEDAERLTGLLGEAQAVVAVENHGRQTVITGTTQALEKLRAIAAALHVAYTPVRSPYPFHSPWVAEAAARFHERIAHLQPRKLTTRVHSPIEGRDYGPGDDLCALLASHLTRPVRFGPTVQRLHAEGVDVFVESGALGGLTGIVERVLGADQVVAVAPLRPQPSETIALATALSRLDQAGLVDATPGGVADDAALGAALLPEVPADRFQMFWTARGADVSDVARHAYRDWDQLVRGLPAEPPVSVNGHPAQVAGANGVAAVTGSESLANGPGGRAEVLDFLVRMYAEALEYPPEVFSEATDLEAELGVDSVKQTELLSRVSQHYGLPPTPADFRVSAHNTLGRVADLVLGSAPAPSAPAPSAPAPSPEPAELATTEPAAPSVPTPVLATGSVSSAVPAATGSEFSPNGSRSNDSSPNGSGPNGSGPNGPGGRAEVLDFLVGMYAEALEYPPEVFSEATDLEAELGVDSVKQTELLSRVSQHYGLPPTPADFRVNAHNTLGRVADLVLAGPR